MDKNAENPHTSLPSENELLFKTWGQINQFMEQVKTTYLTFKYPADQALQHSIEWGDKIFKSPQKANHIIQKEWPQQVKKLKIEYVISDTQDKLERSGVPTSMAHEYAEKYVQQLLYAEQKDGLFTWMSGQNKMINHAKSNLQNLAIEYHARTHGHAMPVPIQFEDLHSVKDVYRFVKDSALQGNWFPFAVYMAQKHHQPVVNLPPVSLHSNDYKKALKGDRTQVRILWNNIFKVVGIPLLTTLIYKGLKKIYQKYKHQHQSTKEKNYVTFRLVTTNKTKTQIDHLWHRIKIVLKQLPFNSQDIEHKNTKHKDTKHETKSKYSEITIQSHRQPSQEDIRQMVEMIQTELSSQHLQPLEIYSKKSYPKLVVKGKNTATKKNPLSGPHVFVYIYC
jgi:hypothetical protein